MPGIRNAFAVIFSIISVFYQTDSKSGEILLGVDRFDLGGISWEIPRIYLVNGAAGRCSEFEGCAAGDRRVKSFLIGLTWPQLDPASLPSSNAEEKKVTVLVTPKMGVSDQGYLSKVFDAYKEGGAIGKAVVDNGARYIKLIMHKFGKRYMLISASDTGEIPFVASCNDDVFGIRNMTCSIHVADGGVVSKITGLRKALVSENDEVRSLSNVASGMVNFLKQFKGR